MSTQGHTQTNLIFRRKGKKKKKKTTTNKMLNLDIQNMQKCLVRTDLLSHVDFHLLHTRL